MESRCSACKGCHCHDSAHQQIDRNWTNFVYTPRDNLTDYMQSVYVYDVHVTEAVAAASSLASARENKTQSREMLSRLQGKGKLAMKDAKVTRDEKSVNQRPHRYQHSLDSLFARRPLFRRRASPCLSVQSVQVARPKSSKESEK